MERSSEVSRKLKKGWISAATTLLLVTSIYAEAASAATTSVYVNGRLAQGEVLVRKGVTYLTLTDLQRLGDYDFRYNKTWRTVTITGGDRGDRFVLTLGSRDAKRNGQNIRIEAAPLSYENKTMIPVRVASQLFDADLQWDSNSNRVLISKKSDSNGQTTSPTSPSRPPASPSGPPKPRVPQPPKPPSF
ncbi:copper amine oxidase N-terminal domain-containing protein [Saccharibacillus sp. JS10]|uniref:copper amine oxidase N-terminal domain-containing protein n=1 Tax=Saccharibacillus sp. JS10 TaxID=2950552 RepID=UPI00210A2E03|nr:copper amine oxidase N-terminal domain-containing protein [Saccharibacillus sp. JS10]MCQ4088195.1 copper amine oxidase N-terminal domain-containing protein [Saccharibacillus sp. JS10]